MSVNALSRAQQIVRLWENTENETEQVDRLYQAFRLYGLGIIEWITPTLEYYSKKADGEKAKEMIGHINKFKRT